MTGNAGDGRYVPPDMQQTTDLPVEPDSGPLDDFFSSLARPSTPPRRKGIFRRRPATTPHGESLTPQPPPPVRPAPAEPFSPWPPARPAYDESFTPQPALPESGPTVSPTPQEPVPEVPTTVETPVQPVADTAEWAQPEASPTASTPADTEVEPDEQTDVRAALAGTPVGPEAPQAGRTVEMRAPRKAVQTADESENTILDPRPDVPVAGMPSAPQPRPNAAAGTAPRPPAPRPYESGPPQAAPTPVGSGPWQATNAPRAATAPPVYEGREPWSQETKMQVGGGLSAARSYGGSTGRSGGGGSRRLVAAGFAAVGAAAVAGLAVFLFWPGGSGDGQPRSCPARGCPPPVKKQAQAAGPPVRVKYQTVERDVGYFEGTVRVVNKGKQPMTTWTISFSYPGADIRNTWEATIRQKGQNVVITNAATARPLPAGASIDVRFGGSGAPSMPQNCRLNDQPCTFTS